MNNLQEYLILEKAVLSMDTSNPTTADHFRDLMDILWPTLSKEELEYLDSRSVEEINSITEPVPLHLYEVMDRVHVIEDTFDDNVSELHWLQDEPELKAQAKKVATALMDLYQLAASKWYHATKHNPDIWLPRLVQKVAGEEKAALDQMKELEKSR